MSNQLIWAMVAVIAIVVVSAFACVCYYMCQQEVMRLLRERRKERRVAPYELNPIGPAISTNSVNVNLDLPS